MNKKTISINILILISIIFFFSSPVFAQQFKTYKDTEHKFSFSYPSTWVPKVIRNDKKFFLMGVYSPKEGPLDNFLDCFVAGVVNLDKEVDLNTFYQKNKGGKRHKLLSEIKTTVNGIPAMKVIYETPGDRVPNKSISYFLVKGKKAFIFEGIAEPKVFNKHKNIVERIVKTFKCW